MTPSNSLTALGPTLFFSALHCANTLNLLNPPSFSLAANSIAGVAILGTHHQPLKSTPPSLAPPTRRRDIDIDLLRNDRACFSKAVPTSIVVRRMGMGRAISLEDRRTKAEQDAAEENDDNYIITIDVMMDDCAVSR